MKMTQEEFQEFVDQCNKAHDKEAFFDRYFDPNIVFVHPYKGTFRGKCADFYEFTGEKISHVQLYLNLIES